LHVKILWVAHKHRRGILSQLEAVDHSKAVAYKKGFKTLKSTITLFGFFVGMWCAFIALRGMGTIIFGSNAPVLKIWQELISKPLLIVFLLNPIVFAAKRIVKSNEKMSETCVP
ncbi:unnamed protein product, partial [Owenia fusiformis]